LFILYERSPKKCCELKDIVIDLQQYPTFTGDGIKPVRAGGTRWISHKLSAMKRILSKFGAYIQHLSTLSEDSSVKSIDHAKLTRLTLSQLALTNLLKTLCEMKKLASKPLNEWATFSTTCAKFVKQGSGSMDTTEY